MLNFIKMHMSNANFFYSRYIIIIQRTGPKDQVVKESCSREDPNPVQIIFIGALAHL